MPLSNNKQSSTRQGSSFSNRSKQACPPSACDPHPGAPRFFLPPACPGTIPTYAGTVMFGNAMWQNGAPLRASLNQLGTEFDQSSRTMITATFAAGKWTATLVPASLTDSLQGQSYSFIGVQINSSDSRKLITNFTIDAFNGPVVAAAPAPVLRNQLDHDVISSGGVQNVYAILPLLKTESSSQRTLLSGQVLNFVNATTQDGIEVTVEGVPNDPAYTVRIFVMNRGIAVCKRYAELMGV